MLLRVLYRGDIGNAFLDGQLISDNFCNGDVWDIRLDPCADALRTNPLVLVLTPVKKNVTVDASAMAGLRETADAEDAALLSAWLVTVDDFPVRQLKPQSHSTRQTPDIGA